MSCTTSPQKAIFEFIILNELKLYDKTKLVFVNIVKNIEDFNENKNQNLLYPKAFLRFNKLGTL